VTALHEVSLSIHAGELVAIVGASGSGKSTMLHLMGSLDHPSTGTVWLNGYQPANLRDRSLSALRAQTIGFVFQQFHLAPAVSVLDNVADGLLYSGAGRSTRRRRAADMLARVGLGHRLTTAHTNSRAANGSGSPSRGRWPVTRRCCWPTSRRAISTPTRERW
jgi:putative ABC transport system ATP-binding protein